MNLMRYILPLAILLVLTRGQIQRKDVQSLSDLELLNLRRAMQDVADDTSSKGYAAIAAYHGYPAQCKENDQDVACCRHGSAVFLQWHRLYVVQMEQALQEKGATLGVPYWDWTKPITDLPDLFKEQNYTDAGVVKMNPWHQGNINMGAAVKQTTRGLDERLFQNELSKDKFTALFEQVLNALEYPNYCQFEVQFEIAHNAMHYLVGGKHPYSMSLLEFAAYDPLFFSYHSNVDRVYSVYEALYGPEGHAPGYDCKQNCEVCDVKGFQENLEPFNRDSNPFPITRTHSTGQLASNRSVFGYDYDSLSLGGLNVDSIKQLLKERRSKDRVFASFRLHGVKMSANIKVLVCSPSSVQSQGRSCEYAGEFFVLGGSIEMSWTFTRPYFHEITDTVLKMGLRLTDNYHVYAEVFNIFGIRIREDILPAPTVEYRPGDDKPDVPIADKNENNYPEVNGMVTLRKDIDRLTDEEVDQLRKAMETVQQKARPYSYQDIAEMHGDPAKCPNPNAKDRMSCCVHGMPNFPHWHRLYVVQLEDALRIEGQRIGIPYWDWTKPGSHIPEVARNKTYYDPKTNTDRNNPFFDAEIQFLNMSMRTSRDVLEGLTQFPNFNENTELMDAILLALEQDNFCDFEIQFEVAHNLIHGLVGGNSSYSMSTLAYSAFDPIFFLHHSFVDKIWSVWTSLQQLRGKPYKAHCAQSYVYEPLKPFAFSSPYNPNERTSAASVPTNIYDHVVNLRYKYDTLDFGGMSLEVLEDYLNTNLKGKPRIFVGILLLGIRKSAVANIYITKPGREKTKAGRLMLLGGPAEMPWRFDRLYRLDITKSMNELDLKWDDPYDVTMEMHEFDGTPVDISLFPRLEVIYKAPEQYFTIGKYSPVTPTDEVVRKSVDDLTEEEMASLRNALRELKNENGPDSFEEIAGFHGAPFKCPAKGENKYACCVHGMPIFPHWHRLLTVQFEQGLRRHNSTVGVPYWDWTKPISSLPKLFAESGNQNPFSNHFIKLVGQQTTRDVLGELFAPPKINGLDKLLHMALNALEEDNFCDFAIHYEVLHNEVHHLIGGKGTYSMATLDYSAFDPFFMILHSTIDRIWIMWQELQIRRKKPAFTARCARDTLNDPLEPFSYPEVNSNELTRLNSDPNLVFYYTRFGYKFDKMELSGLTVDEVSEKISRFRSKDRVYLGLLLSGKQTSLTLDLAIVTERGEYPAGQLHILGGEKEMPWAFERFYKHDVTDILYRAEIPLDRPIRVKMSSTKYNGDRLDDVIEDATIIQRPAGANHEVVVIPINTNSSMVHPKIVIKMATLVKFITDDVTVPMEDLGSFTALQNCQLPRAPQRSYEFGSAHYLPPGDYFLTPNLYSLCNKGLKIHISVEAE